MPPWPTTKIHDTVDATWFHNNGAPAGSGSYRKISNTSSLQWSETSYGVPNPPEPGKNCSTAGCSPLLVDIGRDGFNLGDPGVGVYFDILADGKPIHLQWVAQNENDVFVACDLNENGLIDNGAELFGVGTTIIKTGKKARNGYQAIQQYDSIELGGTNDGKITIDDEVWPCLVTWNDLNADGVSTINEVLPLRANRITSIDINPRKSKHRKDAAGNSMPYWSWVNAEVRRGPKKMKMVDVYFKILE